MSCHLSAASADGFLCELCTNLPIQRFDASGYNASGDFIDQYIYINYLLVCGKPVLSKTTAAFAVNYIKRSKLFSHHNNITLLWLLASTPEFAIPLLSRFSSSVPVFCIEWSSSPRVWCHPAAAWGRLQPEQPEHTATASALLAGSSSCPLQTRSGLKCQLGNVDIWQTELSASLQAVWAVSQRIRQEA